MSENIYKTSDQGFAAYLLLKGYYCIEAIPSGNSTRRKDFVFVDVENPKELEDSYFRYKREPIAAKELAAKFKTAARIAKGGLSNEEMEEIRRG